MISVSQAIALGFLQGVTELFPVSSLGHSVVLPGLLRWRVDQDAGAFLTFLVATHFATALVLFVLYWSDWKRILAGLGRSLRDRALGPGDLDARLGWLLVAGTVPAGIVGLLFEKQVRGLFVSPRSAAFFLIMNGVLLFGAERLRRKAKRADHLLDPDRRIATELTWPHAIRVGLLQIIALIPGFSRTGSTLAGGLLVGLSHEDSLRYSFLLATPIIGAAAALKLPRLLLSGGSGAISVALLGAVAAAIAAYASVKFLTRYFRTKTLVPFAVYCALAGSASLVLLVR
ncbi:MAG: undecaprenyl-diphosphatase [Gemmatimonadetes bacterium]|nr:MAG: undecaprenyl-diphosphatase [Gemmatimonadota bacterium]